MYGTSETRPCGAWSRGRPRGLCRHCRRQDRGHGTDHQDHQHQRPLRVPSTGRQARGRRQGAPRPPPGLSRPRECQGRHRHHLDGGPSQLKPSRTGSISSSPSYRRRREPRGDGRQQPVSGYTVQMDNEDLDLDASIRPGTGSYLGQGTDGTASGPPHWPTRKRQAHCTEFQPPPQTTWS